LQKGTENKGCPPLQLRRYYYEVNETKRLLKR